MARTEAETIVDQPGNMSILDAGLQIVTFPVLCGLNFGIFADEFAGVSRLGDRPFFRVTPKAWHCGADHRRPILNGTQKLRWSDWRNRINRC